MFPIGLKGLLGGGLGGALVPLLDIVDALVGTLPPAVRAESFLTLIGLNVLGFEIFAPETLEPLLGESFSLPFPPLLTEAVTLDANRLKGDMLLENALGVPELLPVRLRFALPLVRVEGVDR